MRALRWADFSLTCGEIAALAEQRFRARQLCLVGTLRRNGYPRISPCEPDSSTATSCLG